MRTFITIGLLTLTAFFQPAFLALAEETPPRSQQPEQPKYKDFKKLTEKEITAFYKVYQEDPEPHEQGGFARGWIVGEAPLTQKEPLAHFPTKGRLTARGMLSMGKDGLTFTTAIRGYVIKDRYFAHQLDKLGFSKKSKPRAATIDGYWVNLEKTSGYTLLYFRSVKLE
ncbi:MAG: hypothetical protein N2C14_08745 [Planctomycetales bacterium]